MILTFLTLPWSARHGCNDEKHGLKSRRGFIPRELSRDAARHQYETSIADSTETTLRITN